jgi:hypothetical protein
MCTRLIFCPDTILPEKLKMVVDGRGHFPKAEAGSFRRFLPSLSHHLATGHVLRGFVEELETL